MRLRTAVTTLAALAFAAGAPLASAQDDKRGKGHEKHGDDAPASRDSKFRSWDKDGNGSLSRGEYQGHPGNFRALDTDGDGALSREEFQHRGGASAPAAPADDFTAKDHDGNGVVSRSEWPDAFEFDRRDHNRDGVVSRAEYGSPREPAARDEQFLRLDANNDGVVSRAEWRGRASAFDALDTNRDGVVTRNEYVRGAARGRLVK
jgi:Ca2+-binding EF-hand superfamily protein